MVSTQPRIALLSVFHKEGIVEFAQGLQSLEKKGQKWLIYASSGTAKVLREANVPVIDMSDIVGEPILDHRVVTLSRRIHAGLLSRETPEDEQVLYDCDVQPIDLLCVDLYPLEEAMRNSESDQSIREMTDIVDVALLRSAVKGQRIVLCDPKDRFDILKWLHDGEPDRATMIRNLGAKAEACAALYTARSAQFLSEGRIQTFVGFRTLQCVYGENAWQHPAGLYQCGNDDPFAFYNFMVARECVPLSYNNLCDLDRGLQTITHIAAVFEKNSLNVPSIALGFKHGNCCGAAVSSRTNISAIENMIAGDRIAIFGGCVMVNFVVDEPIAKSLLYAHMENDTKRLLDMIVAPMVTDDAIELLRRKNGKCRILANLALAHLGEKSLDRQPRIRMVRGGFLMQPNYTFVPNFYGPDLTRYGLINFTQESDMLLAWAVGSTSNSNTVTLVRNGMLLGNAVGQQDRVGACRLAVLRAKRGGHDLRESVAYSDSFFPFTDGPQILADENISAIFTSQGSVRDQEVIDFCVERHIVLVMIPDAQGRGFFGH